MSQKCNERGRRLPFRCNLADAGIESPADIHRQQQVRPMQLCSPETIDFNGMRLDLPGHSLRDASGHEVQLTRGEFAILTALARRPAQVLSRDQLLDAVSGRSADAFDRSIDNLISRLRRKIEPDPKKPRFILSVRGAGYKFSPRPDPGKLPPAAAAARRCPILVIPFSNLSGGRELSQLAEAVSVALMAELRHSSPQGSSAPTAGAGTVEARRVTSFAEAPGVVPATFVSMRK